MANSSLLVCLLAALLSGATSSPLWLRDQELFSPKRPASELTLERAAGDYRLPTNLKPSSYAIQIIPYFNTTLAKSFVFEGQVVIDFMVKEASKSIKLHAGNMTIVKEDILVNNTDTGDLFTVVDFSITQDDKQFFTINLEEEMPKDANMELSILYEGILSDDLEGFYRSRYVNNAGEEKWMGVTHFEPTAARRAFPCFDEPAMKAMFTLRIAKQPGMNVLANMPEEPGTGVEPVDEENLPGWVWVDFTESVAMSTYLVAFSVSEFINTPNDADDTLKVWARPDAVETGEYAASITDDLVKFYENFTNVDFALPKIDQIAVPDFAAGAMENWGLITYRETALLYDPAVSTSTNKQRVATVVAHELAHQWFGDYVSPEWWSNLWLNEGFATYFEYHSTATVETTWNLEQQFVLEQCHEVLKSDALLSSHPVLADVESPDSINSIFDDISYNKGGCLIRMMVTFMGEENFKKGIFEYLDAKKFDNAHQNDLWEHLGANVGAGMLPGAQTLAAVMNTWTTQPGYPVVHVERDYASGKANITQMRFLTSKDEENHDERWIVPLSFTTADSPNFEDTSSKIWLQKGGASVLLNAPAKNKWIMLNVKQTGYYRVNYDPENWALIAEYLESHANMGQIHVINRAQLIDDALALARAGLLDYTTALESTAYLHHENTYAPWYSALTALGYVNDRLAPDTTSRDNFQWYILKQLAAVYKEVGFTEKPEDSHMLRLKRSLVLRWACNLESEDCNKDAGNLFSEWMEKKNPDTENPIVPDLKSVVYCAGMRRGTRPEYDFLFDRYRNTKVASEQALIISALGCASDPKLLQTYLDDSIKATSEIRAQDARSVFNAVFANPIGVDIALDFLIKNFDIIKNLYGGFGSMGRVFSGIGAKLNTKEQLAKLVEFSETEGLGETVKAVKDAIVLVQEQVAWQEEHSDTVAKWFKTKRSNSAVALAISPLLLLLAALMLNWA